jgi:hypothetical protein
MMAPNFGGPPSSAGPGGKSPGGRGPVAPNLGGGPNFRGGGSIRPPKGFVGAPNLGGGLGGAIQMDRPQEQQDDPNAKGDDEQGPIMELVVYGYVTLYERYPPKPEAAKAKGKTAGPGQLPKKK